MNRAHVHVRRRPARRKAVAAIVPVILLAGFLVAACSGSGGIRVTGAWARSSPMTASAGAAYLVIENTGTSADTLIGASSPAARTVEVHETVDVSSAAPSGSAMPAASGGMSSGGMMGMQKVDRVEVPAGGRLELKPGSYHLMMIGLTQDLRVGDRIDVTLRFEKTGAITVTAEVRAG